MLKEEMRLKTFLALTLLFSLPQSFADAGRAFGSAGTWVYSLPQEFQQRILWYADHEEGNLYDWEYDDPDMSGGGIFNTGSPEEAFAEAVSSVAFSGTYSVQATIKNAFRSMNGNKAVRLMRWTDKPWDMGGKNFPKAAYYSTWMMIPENYNPTKEAPWDPGDGGWWNVFQFKSKDKKGESQPLWVLNIGRDEASGQMKPYLYTKYNKPHSYDLAADPLPVGQWFHIEAYFKQSGRRKRNGAIAFWLNGTKIFKARRVVTRLHGAAIIWGIGNYTDHIDGGAAPGSATVYFDDAIVSTAPVHRYVAR